MSRLTDAMKKAKTEGDLTSIKAGVAVSNAASHGSIDESIDESVDLDLRTWEQKIAQETEKLLECERRLISQDWEQANVTSQVSLHQQLLDQLQKQLHQMQQKMANVSKDQSALKTVHDASAKRLANLQKCQVVTQELHVTRQELDTSTYILNRINKSQERLNREQDRHIKHSRTLQQNLQELQQQLSRALAAFDNGSTATFKQKELTNNE